MTYESVLKRVRRVYHGLVADWLIDNGGERVNEYTGLIAEHLEQAGHSDQAILYLHKAGDQAVRQYANEEAIGYYQRALALIAEQSPEDTIYAETRPQLHESVGDVYSSIGQHDDARGKFQSALTLTPVEDILWQARLQRKIGRTRQDQGQYDETERAFEAAEEILGQPPAEHPQSWWREWIWIQINRLYGMYARAQSNEMVALVEKMQSAVEQYGSPQQHEAFYGSQLRMYLRRDRYVISEEMLDISRKRLSAAVDVGEKQKVADAQFQAGFILLWYGDLDQSEAALQRALKLAEQSGYLYTQTLCFTYLAILYRFRGRVQQVKEYIERSIAAATERQMINYIGTAKANQAWVDWRQGDLAAAESNGKEALKLWGEVPFSYPLKWAALWPLMGVAVEKDQIEMAVQYASDLLAPEQQRLPDEVLASLEGAMHAWQSNQPGVARQKLEHALALAEEIKQL